jgi:phospholipid/cholesterol/gamma-HCH transport system permease protein
MIEKILGYIGRPFLHVYEMIERFGAFILFQVQLLKLYHLAFGRYKIVLTQIEVIGLGCMGVVTLTALFTGMVLAIQLYNGFHQFGAENFTGYTVFFSITRELGPVFASLMLISRSISAMAAELGTMRVSEQIDAIDILGVDSKEYLITPRIIATVISLPLLVIWFDFIAIGSGYVISTGVLGINPISYQETLLRLGEFDDIMTGLIKAAVFGFIVSSHRQLHRLPHERWGARSRSSDDLRRRLLGGRDFRHQLFSLGAVFVFGLVGAITLPVR